MPELCSEEVNHFYHLIRACLHVPKKLPEKDFNYYYHKNANLVTQNNRYIKKRTFHYINVLIVINKFNDRLL